MENEKNILDFIFEARCDEIAYITEKDKEFLNSKKANIDNYYSIFKMSLQKLPDEIREEIFEHFMNYSNTQDYITGYFNEKYYKIGFSDCMRLILNC